MQPDAAALLWDVRRAGRLIADFTAARSWNDYSNDPMLRSAVERQFQIVGEALNRLSRVDGQTAERIPELARIVAFRNILVHAYTDIDDAVVWRAATSRVPQLVRVIEGLLETRGD